MSEGNRPSGLSPAEALYVEFLAQSSTGSGLDFEGFRALHPGHAEELCRLQAEPEALRRLEREARSLVRGVSPASASREERFARAEALLGEHFARREAGDASAGGLAGLVAAHPDLEHELESLWRDCGAVDGALGVGQETFAARNSHVQELIAELRAVPGFEQRYAVLGEVAQGGMGAVLRVEDRQFGRLLAMKVVLGQADVGRTGKTPPVAPQQLQRFLNEARITATLDHPGIVPVHELGAGANGRAFFTMKLVQGRTLREVFRLQGEGDPAWSRARVLSLFQRLCDAMAYAHERGVIHRDLKPANVMVGDFGEVYVMDWGLARRVGEQEPAPGASKDESDSDVELLRTREGAILGTPAYMPPEQAAGRIGELGPQSDVYAVGAMLYHLLGGHAPYCGPGESSGESRLLRRIQAGPPRPLGADAPPELVAICEHAMARRPAARYPDMRALAADLGAYLEGRVVRAYRTGAWAEARTWITRNRALATATGAALLTLVAGFGTSTKLYLRAEDSAVQARESAQQADDNARTARASEERARASEKAARDSASEAEAARVLAVESESAAQLSKAKAEAETRKALAIQGFLEQTIARADPTKDPADLLLRDVVLASAGDIDGAFPDLPDVRARLHLLVSDSLFKLGALDEAEQHGRAALEAFRAAGAEDSREYADSWYLCGFLAQARHAKGKLSEEQRQRGIADLEQSVRLYRALPGDNEVLARRSEGSVAYLQQLPTESDAELPEEFVRFVAGVWKETDLEVVRARLESNMRHVAELWEAGDHQRAKDFLRTDFQPYLGSSALRQLAAGYVDRMGSTAELKGRLTFAEVCHALALDIVTEAGDLPLSVATCQANTGFFLEKRARLGEAAECLAAAAPVLLESLGGGNADARNVLGGAANLLLGLERFAEAHELLMLGCEEGRDDQDVPRIDLRHWLVLEALALEGLGRSAEGLPLLEEARALVLPASAKPRITRQALELHRGRLLARSGALAAAEELLLPLWDELDAGEDKELRKLAARSVGVFLRAKGEAGEAEYFEQEAR